MPEARHSTSKAMTSEKYKLICRYLRELIEGSVWEGKVYTVGGCCRDTIIGAPIKDVDLAVALPDGGIAFAEWLHKKHLTIGEPVKFRKYGTARMYLRKFPGEEIELVQTRSEKYTDRTSRDPSTAFGSIEDDCYRRDLTINSLYYDISGDRMLDITGKGIADIENHLIRTPSEPDMTFDDDPVRIIRTVRFATRFGWEIDPAAMSAMKKYASRLEIITPERMQSEFDKILECPTPSRALNLLREVGAMRYIIPELEKEYDLRQSEYHFGTVWEHSLATADLVPPQSEMRLAALLHDIGKTLTAIKGRDGQNHFPGHDRRCARIINTALRRLRYRTESIDRIIFLCMNHEAAKRWGDHAQNMSDEALRRLQYKCVDKKRFNKLMTLIDADNRTYAPAHCMPEQVPAIMTRSQTLLDEGTAMFGYHLPVKALRIRKILHLPASAEAEIAHIKEYLMRAAFVNPLLSRAQLCKMVELNKYNCDEDSPKRRNHRRRKKS